MTCWFELLILGLGSPSAIDVVNLPWGAPSLRHERAGVRADGVANPPDHRAPVTGAGLGLAGVRAERACRRDRGSRCPARDVQAIVATIRRWRPPLADRLASRDRRGAVVLTWSGMRGLITLATAFALPHGRDLIVLCAFCVVLGTLVIQGFTLQPLMRLPRFEDDGAVARAIRGRPQGCRRPARAPSCYQIRRTTAARDRCPTRGTAPPAHRGGRLGRLAIARPARWLSTLSRTDFKFLVYPIAILRVDPLPKIFASR
jgi:hypothetical protein